ncbi:MAG: hypothetical protein CL678_06830 [Bdellovibrionaceae bacterium]|nr:hypothetical protein [Pseudobdellovibrionaceae bacterium]|tara:strand:+ start:179 stop:2146 length:1968 start_codon:yes stop_codon:yes gene_type:complete
MSLSIWESEFDLVVVAGPRLQGWPSVGVRTLSSLSADVGLKVGLFGGQSLQPFGVIPLPGHGGVVIAKDTQNRLHRISGRAVVKVTQDLELPNPFLGWRSPGLIPLDTARRLLNESPVVWAPSTVILGTGNKALRFGSELLEKGTPEVFAIQTYSLKNERQVCAWEVEKRRFEMLGGKIIYANPIRLAQKTSLLWELHIQDSIGNRIIETARVVSAGPFIYEKGIREYPPGALLFEFLHTAPNQKNEDVEGWNSEEERGRWLATKIIKSLVVDLGNSRQELEKQQKKARSRLRLHSLYQEEPFLIHYDKKWVKTQDLSSIKEFEGVPQKKGNSRLLPVIECIEKISCRICEDVCPEDAILIQRIPGRKNKPLSFLKENQCVSCAKCLDVCPSNSISLMKMDQPNGTLGFSFRGKEKIKINDRVQLGNRRGQNLATGRVTHIENEGFKYPVVHIEVPEHLLWEARGMKPSTPDDEIDDEKLMIEHFEKTASQKVEITFEGESRLVREGLSISKALFEIGYARTEDVFMCSDGSCGLCEVNVDGVKKKACQTTTRRGMVLKIREKKLSKENSQNNTAYLCPCLGITREEIIKRIENGNLQSPEAVQTAVHVGEGKCHGLICMGAFRRLLEESEIDTENWIDWRFPWFEWKLFPGPHG